MHPFDPGMSLSVEGMRHPKCPVLVHQQEEGEPLGFWKAEKNEYKKEVDCEHGTISGLDSAVLFGCDLTDLTDQHSS